jgi:antitoxin (DNA-binding transcriptional repressor) of toxin-antitoxin stability system
MKEITISKFRATCFAVIEHIRKTRQPIRITRLGKPLAEILPLIPQKKRKIRLGAMAGTARILGDIVGPTGSLDDWDGDEKNVFSTKS